jgi:hypothetical protein
MMCGAEAVAKAAAPVLRTVCWCLCFIWTTSCWPLADLSGAGETLLCGKLLLLIFASVWRQALVDRVLCCRVVCVMNTCN